MNRAADRVEQSRVRLLDQLFELLRIPSVSADPGRDGACRQAADWLRDRLRTIGCSVELLGSASHPVVHARGPDMPGRPTVLVYGHYDVQPPEPLDAWHTPPFTPTIRDGCIHARGATDDKGQLLALIAAWEMALADGDPPVNIRFLIEGGEETGSDEIIALVTDAPELVTADVALVADSPFHAPGWPTVELGVRGLCYVEITVRTLTRDVHSGLYGGVAPNAHHALVRILAGLSDRAGRLRLPGINRAVRRPTAAERDAWAALPFDEAAFTHDEVGATALVGDARRSVLERLWARPSLDIHGITGGFSGKGVKTVIPAEARAKVSLRLVPDQQPAQVLALLAHRVGELAPDWATVSVRPLILTEPVLVDIAGPWLAPLDAAFHEAFGHGLSLVRSGGSLPILGALGSGGATVLMAGIGLPDDGLHSPNERIAIPQFLNGIRAFASYFRRLGHLHTGVRS